MKKHLIAAAVAAAIAAPAMAQNVTLSGTLDFAAANQTGTIAGIKGTTVSSTIGNSATSSINIVAIEDLGGGMKAEARYELDPRLWMNDGSASMARHQAFIGLSGGFGNIRLGAPNSLSLGVFGTSSPFGTNVGGGYVGTEFGLTSVPRYSRSVRYDSPNLNGVTLSAIYAPGNDEVVTQSAAANGIPNARPTKEFGATYSSGALNVAFVHRITDATAVAATPFAVRAANGAIWFDANGANAADARAESAWSSLGANYKLGATTVYFGWNNGETNNATGAPLTTKGNRVALKHDMGAMSLLAGYSSQKTDGSATVPKQSVLGLRADYNLSKRSVAYAAYEDYNNGLVAADERKITSVGIRHSF